MGVCFAAGSQSYCPQGKQTRFREISIGYGINTPHRLRVDVDIVKKPDIRHDPTTTKLSPGRETPPDDMSNNSRYIVFRLSARGLRIKLMLTPVSPGDMV